MPPIDEPALNRPGENFAHRQRTDAAVPDRIRALMTDQHYGVLCTQGGGQPYGSVVAFAANEELNAVAFATPVATRKYRLIAGCDRVSLVVDNRTAFPGDVSRINAVTATGKANILALPRDVDSWKKQLIEKHPHMRSFISAESTALVRIDVLRYLHVVRLQEVYQWVPPPPG